MRLDPAPRNAYRVGVMFEGVLYPNTRYTPRGEEKRLDEKPVADAIRFLCRLVDQANIEPWIMTTYPLQEVRDWLNHNAFPEPYLPQVGITDEFTRMDTYIMDRTIPFEGLFPTIAECRDVMPWLRTDINTRRFRI